MDILRAAEGLQGSLRSGCCAEESCSGTLKSAAQSQDSHRLAELQKAKQELDKEWRELRAAEKN